MFILRFIQRFLTTIMKFLVFGVVSFTTLLGAIYFVDNLTHPSYGEINIYLIAGVFSFFPMFTGLFVIFFWNQLTKEKKKAQKREKEYLKEDIVHKPINEG